MMKFSIIKPPVMNTNPTDGFTIVELIIAMLVSSIIGIAVVSNSFSQQRSSDMVRQIALMQQQLRGSMYIMEQDLRIAGYDPRESELFGVTNVQRFDITDENTASSVDPAGSPSLRVAFDWDPANAATTADGLPNEFIPAYRLFDDNNDGIMDLVRDDDTPGVVNRQLVAEGIEAIGFAYAFDDDLDGNLDRTAVGNNIIWAVDSNNDNRLDANLDANDDGVIDLNDDDGDGRINTSDNALPTEVTVDRIRAVRIWLLARERRAGANASSATAGFSNQGQTFLVGDQVVPNTPGGFNDNIRRRLMTKTVVCRNTGLLQ